MIETISQWVSEDVRPPRRSPPHSGCCESHRAVRASPAAPWQLHGRWPGCCRSHGARRRHPCAPSTRGAPCFSRRPAPEAGGHEHSAASGASLDEACSCEGLRCEARARSDSRPRQGVRISSRTAPSRLAGVDWRVPVEPPRGCSILYPRSAPQLRGLPDSGIAETLLSATVCERQTPRLASVHEPAGNAQADSCRSWADLSSHGNEFLMIKLLLNRNRYLLTRVLSVSNISCNPYSVSRNNVRCLVLHYRHTTQIARLLNLVDASPAKLCRVVALPSIG